MLYAIIFFGTVILDQLTKAIVDANDYQIPVIKDFFLISNIRNDGAAFSMFAGKEWAMPLFYALTSVSLAVIVCYFIFKKNDSKWLDISIVLIAAGAVGNFIDRIAFGEVRDFLYFTFFANFNVADVAVTVGGIMLVFYFLFLDEEAIFKRKKVDALKEENGENEK